MKIKNEKQYEAMVIKYTAFIDGDGDENSAAAIKMQDAMAAWEEYEENCQMEFWARGAEDFLDSEYDRQPHPSDADSGL